MDFGTETGHCPPLIYTTKLLMQIFPKTKLTCIEFVGSTSLDQKKKKNLLAPVFYSSSPCILQ